MTLHSVIAHLTRHAARYAWLVIALFVLSKLNRLDYPFYWDEGWVYGPAVQAMAEAGPSLLPGVIDEGLGRGHPLLFHFLGGLWIKVFGDSLWVIHGFALAISAGVLAGMFYGIKALTHGLVALTSIMVLACFKVFHVQSVFVLPEILLAAGCLASVYFFAKQQWIGLLISGSLMLLTKESGLPILATLIGVEVLLCLNRRGVSWLNVKVMGSLIGSAIPYALFLWWQKQTSGWYFFPEHTGYLNFDFTVMLGQIVNVGQSIFYVDDLHYVSALLLLSVVLLLRRKLPLMLKGSIILQCLLFLFLFAAEQQPIFPVITQRAVMLFYGLLGVNVLVYPLSRCSQPVSRMVVASLFCIFNFIIFASINFYSYRYLLAVFPLVMLLPVVLAHLAEVKPQHYLAAGLLLCCLFLPKLFPNDKIFDTEPGYIHAVQANQMMVSYVERHVPLSAGIRTTFLGQTYLSNPLSGYLSGAPYTHWRWDGFDYLITMNGTFEEVVSQQDLVQDTAISLPGISLGVYHRKPAESAPPLDTIQSVIDSATVAP
jgi:hypothetical protein